MMIIYPITRNMSHPQDLIIDDSSQWIKTRSSLRNMNNYLAFISQIESKNIKEIENDLNWIMAMEEELNQFQRNNVWTLVKRPLENTVIETKWIYRNKLDEYETIIRNKARLVA